jgi:uncharacterized protein YlbG (UPF0298 family)
MNKSDISESYLHTEDEHSVQNIEMSEITNTDTRNENNKQRTEDVEPKMSR